MSVQCKFQEIPWLVDGVQYTCFPATVTSDGVLTRVLSFTGDHLGGKRNNDVTGFIANNHQVDINQLPKDIEKFFPKLKVLGWDGGNISTLTAADLRPFPELRFFSIHTNKLVSIKSDIFKYTPNVKWVNFGKNQLLHVGYDLIDSLEHLTQAYFDSNICIDFYAENSEQIQELSTKLKDQCPSLEKCSFACSILIDDVKEENLKRIDEITKISDNILLQNEKIVEMRSKIIFQSENVSEISGKLSKEILIQNKQTSELGTKITLQDGKIVELRSKTTSQSENISKLSEEILAQNKQSSELTTKSELQSEKNDQQQKEINELRSNIFEQNLISSRLAEIIKSQGEEIIEQMQEKSQLRNEIKELSKEIAKLKIFVSELVIPN